MGMNFWYQPISRRDFLKLGVLTLGSLAFRPWIEWQQLAADWPDAERLGRICVGKVDIRARPSADSPSVGVLYEDAVVVWLREVVGEVPAGRQSRRWVETPDGYIYAPSVQPVRNLPNTPVNELPQTSLGKGMWVEVTVPHVQIFLENREPASPWLKYVVEHGLIPRLYYSQILWVDGMTTNSQGQVLYRINERYGPGDVFWAAAEAFRPLTVEELTPISPEVEDKRVVVDVTPTRQMLYCYEGKTEVYACQISSGAKWDAAGNLVEKWGTPLGPHPIWRKAISIHMSGGQTGTGYDLPGVAWTTLFTGEGVAIHSTFWHNDFGTPRSHGCVNCAPEDAKFVFRWTKPIVPYDPGDVTVSMPGGTIVEVIEA
ncbi:MAG: L,D-transpeptidase [Thermanaerothrix sp.]|jgi:lipoprotein-anchoring transpeptidase ErfK/SrfK|uniref:L,D-transpeptidase n=1 Tax=Thermanaerothrix solaris TaxID=3058434 RepID=A0ABU3NJ16_9CHLR|nr:L,D-transpeptidase [Thermanaerothrix sp. 4228-RoL]MDT8896843.1 L,D-transpeptidase [Thermanaerothrix sp. 4228-RoL]